MTRISCSTRTQVVVELAELYRQSLPITLATFWGPLLLLLCGAILAVLVAVAETFYYIRIERVCTCALSYTRTSTIQYEYKLR